MLAITCNVKSIRQAVFIPRCEIVSVKHIQNKRDKDQRQANLKKMPDLLHLFCTPFILGLDSPCRDRRKMMNIHTYILIKFLINLTYIIIIRYLFDFVIHHNLNRYYYYFLFFFRNNLAPTLADVL